MAVHCTFFRLLAFLLIIFLGKYYVVGKNLKTDIDQIKKIVDDWEDDVEGFEEVGADNIPNLDRKQIHIVEKEPGTEGQAYIVYRQMAVDNARYTRHIAYLLRFKGVSSVEFSPFDNPTGNEANGDFVSLLAPSRFTTTRCNARIGTAYEEIHNYFYRHEEKCTIPSPYQDCCEGPNAIREDVDFDAMQGKAIDLKTLDNELDTDEPEDSEPEPQGPRRPKKKFDINSARPMGRALVMKKVVRQDILDELEDALQNINGPPGYQALGEFYGDILEVMNGSKLVYEARHRVDAAYAAENLPSGSPFPILDAETFMLAGFEPTSSGIPTFEDPQSVFSGILACNYSAFKSKSLAHDKLKENVVKFYLHALRAHCVPNAYEKALALFEKELLTVTTGLRLELNPENDLVSKALLNKEEWIDLISAVFFSTLSNAYMDTLEMKSRKVNDNQDPALGPISWSTRTLTVMILRVVELVDEQLQTHVVKILQLAASIVKEQFFVSLHRYLKLESICKSNPKFNCKEPLEMLRNDQLQLLSLTQFIIFGTSTALQAKVYALPVEFNIFYAKTLDHMKGIMEKINLIRGSLQVVAQKDAASDAANNVEFAGTPAPVQVVKDADGGGSALGDDEVEGPVPLDPEYDTID